jgi:APA family basic amino acid/polyamine antiporter
MTDTNLLGRWSSTAIVLGNMIGAGVFMMPALLAPYGGISMLGWLFSSIGAVLIAVLFSKLSKLLPGLQGGPYAFTRAGMGDMPGFLVAWGYWISIWTTNAALAVAFVSYLGIIVPILKINTGYALLTAIGVIWILTWFNTLGIGKAGKLAIITTILKIIPILAVSIFGLFFLNLDYFTPFNNTGGSNFSAIVATITLTFFAFLGIESATIPAESVEDPSKVIPFATKLGTLLAIVIYMLSSFVILGMIPASELAVSQAPFADAAMMVWGEGAQYFIAWAAVISVFGALNGWILLQGQMPLAIAKDDLFPTVFAKVNKNGSPILGLLLSSFLATVLIIMNYSGGLLKVFEFMILVSTVAVLIPYIFCAISYIRIAKSQSIKIGVGIVVVSIGVLLFSVIALIGSGQKAFLWGILFLSLGIPVFRWMKSQKSKDSIVE